MSPTPGRYGSVGWSFVLHSTGLPVLFYVKANTLVLDSGQVTKATDQCFSLTMMFFFLSFPISKHVNTTEHLAGWLGEKQGKNLTILYTGMDMEQLKLSYITVKNAVLCLFLNSFAISYKVKHILPYNSNPSKLKHVHIGTYMGIFIASLVTITPHWKYPHSFQLMN